MELPTLSLPPEQVLPHLKGLPASAREYADRKAAVAANFPLLPLDSPGIARPGPDVLDLARRMVPYDYQPPALKGVLGKARAAALEAAAPAAKAYAADLDQCLGYIYTRALYDPTYELPVRVKGRHVMAPLLSGTFRTMTTPDGTEVRVPGWGPRRADVMVIGQNPGMEESRTGENFVGPGSAPLVRALAELAVDPLQVARWYWTNVVKHPQLDPSSKGVPAAHLKNCLPLLQMELRLVRPKFILLFGGPAASAVLGKGSSVNKLFARVLPVEVPLADGTVHVAQAMAVTHPASVARNPDAYTDLVNGLAMFLALVAGTRTADAEPDICHGCIYTEHGLKSVVEAILAETPSGATIAVDAEWHGRRPDAPGAYLRTIQFSHKGKHAWCVVLRSQGGKDAFRPGPAAAIPHLARLLKSTPDRPVRIGGHYLRADLPWLLHAGLDLRPEYEIAPTPELTRTQGGWDTLPAVHAVQETMEGGYKLENLAARYNGVPRYDLAMQRWKDDYCRKTGLKDRELDGYGAAPDSTLHSYACYDSDSTWRLWESFGGSVAPDGTRSPGFLDRDFQGHDCREAYWHSMAAAPAALEMEMTGVALDTHRGDVLTAEFARTFEALLGAFRRRIGWEGTRVQKLDRKKQPCFNPDGSPVLVQGLPAFNPNSTEHCRELLFGVDLNSKIDKVTGRCRRLSPPTVQTLDLTPITASGDRPTLWERVVQDGQVGVFWPSTGKESLGILSHTPGEAGQTVGMLRDLRFLAQVLKGVLKRPWAVLGGEAARVLEVEDGELTEQERLIYDGGLMYWIDHDGRVRTHFGLVETGRWSSWLPNCQNISKRREDDYKRILGYYEWDKEKGKWAAKGQYKGELGLPRYDYPVRAMLTAAPGHVLIEADFKMAEMALIGWLAQDPTMMENVRRNSLDEDDPDFLDLHSQTAINAFRLDTPENRQKLADYNFNNDTSIAWGASKACLKAIGKSSLRVAAKNVAFGTPYGRSAEAIARQCREEGADVSVAEAQLLIDEYLQTNYPRIGAFLLACKARVLDPGWIRGIGGRYRRFARTDDEAVLGEMERAASNYLIQNGVAEAINLACYELRKYQQNEAKASGRSFRFCLQIHDALLFEVPIADAAWFVDEVLEECMSRRVPIYPRDLDGVPLPGVGPYFLGVDTEVCQYWGEPLTRDWGMENGLPEVTPKGRRLLPKPVDRLGRPPIERPDPYKRAG